MIVYQHRIFRRDLRLNPRLLYVFGDNVARVGLGGQAGECRGEPNAHGIATLDAPGAFWSDDSLGLNVAQLERDFAGVEAALREGRVIVWPADNIGTGLAELPKRAPRTFADLQRRLMTLQAITPGVAP